jgi:hypothetical protein
VYTYTLFSASKQQKQHCTDSIEHILLVVKYRASLGNHGIYKNLLLQLSYKHCRFLTGLNCRLKEVIKDFYSLVLINIFDIHALEFVFHPVTLEKRLINWAAMHFSLNTISLLIADE